MKRPAFLQPRILKQALRAVFSPRFTTRFPQEPHRPGAGFRGRPRFDPDGCIGCGACAQVCPAKCIDVVDDLEATTATRTLIQHLDVCIWCGQCERHCPTGRGIRMSDEYDCVGFEPGDFEERVVKPLLLCENCGVALAPIDQLRWLAARLGPASFANPSLMLAAGRDLGAVGPGVKRIGERTLRGDRLRIQCPKCRRKSAFAA